MLRYVLFLAAFAGYVLGMRLPLHRVVHTGPARTEGVAAGRIFGGQDATSGQFPYEVSVQVSVLGYRCHFCGGALVSSSAVLTGARCADQDSTFYVAAGELNLNINEGTEQVKLVSEQITHPDFPGDSERPANDIAIFKPSSPFTLNDYVQTIQLPSAGTVPPSGSVAVISGWGATPTARIPAVLQWQDLPVVDLDTCRQLYGPAGDVAVVDTIVCTPPGRNGGGVCTGDLGSPLALDGAVIGVTTFFPCVSDHLPSGYTRVSAYNDFINQYL